MKNEEIEMECKIASYIERSEQRSIILHNKMIESLEASNVRCSEVADSISSKSFMKFVILIVFVIIVLGIVVSYLSGGDSSAGLTNINLPF